MEKIQKMIESKDVEMVRLGALLLEKEKKREEWMIELQKMSPYHHLSINHGHIVVTESDWIFPLESYKFIIIDFDKLEENNNFIKSLGLNKKKK